VDVENSSATRAQHLKLGRAVVPKFLPERGHRDLARIERSLGDVCIARQISSAGAPAASAARPSSL
jgi:hypothetical protein